MRSATLGIFFVTTGLFLTSGSNTQGEPVGTAFTYQGQLKRAGVPVTGSVDFEFSMWTAASGGTRLAVIGPVTLELVDGLFTERLDFGEGVFTGDARWLEVLVEDTLGARATLSPRQQITTTPYALTAKQAEDLELPFSGTVDTAAIGVALTQVGSGRVLSLNKTGGGSEAVVYASQGGTGACGQFLVANQANSNAAVEATSAGSGPGVHGKAAASGVAVKGTALGSGRAASFHTEYATNDSPTVYAEQKGGGRCGHFRITNANNDTDSVAASTTGDGAAVSGYTIGEGSAGKFEINNTSSVAPAVFAKTNGSGYAVSAESATDAAPSGGGTVIIGSPGGLNVVLDKDEVMARNNGETPTLFINNDGGDVVFGGAIDIGYERVSFSSSSDHAEVHCPAGKKVISGGCSCGMDDVQLSYPPEDGDSWYCLCSGDGTSAIAICANVK